MSLWSKLSDEQKLAWAAAHGMEHVDSGEDTPPAAATPTAVKKAPALEPEAPPTQPATEEDGKKKKKKHHKDKDSEHKSEKKDKKKRKKVCVCVREETGWVCVAFGAAGSNIEGSVM